MTRPFNTIIIRIGREEWSLKLVWTTLLNDALIVW